LHAELNGGVRAGHVGVRQRVERQGRVPHRRDARLQADGVVLLDDELFELLEGVLHFGRVVAVAEAAQGDGRVDHGRENGPEAVAVLQVLQHPRGRTLDGGLPHGPHQPRPGLLRW